MLFHHRLRPSLSQIYLSRKHYPSPYHHYQFPYYKSTASSSSFFSTSSSLLAPSREPNYYEILDVPVTATPAEIKKKFYSLSLRHHPDRNRNDPTASTRFARISSAYHVLSNAAKRSIYDRDHGFHHHSHSSSSSSSSTHSSAQPGQHPMGSYSSHSTHGPGASYFGSRPASGLSKRRGAFRGPPPSFYAHGGYGGTNRNTPPAGAGAGAAAGPGPRDSNYTSSSSEDDPTAFIHRNPVSHFNARGHYKTQSAEDIRRAERRTREMRSDINDQYIGSRGDFALRFIVVCGILVGAGTLSGFFRWPSSSDGRTISKTTKATRQKDD